MKRALAIILPLLLLLAIIGGGVYAVTYRGDDIADLLISRGEAKLEQGEFDDAIQYYTYAGRFSKQNPSIALSLSNAYALSGNYTKAEYTLVSQISIQPGNADLYKALSRVYVQQGKLFDAEQMLNRIADDTVRAELDAMRPAAPALSAASGSYNTHLELSLSFESGTAFLSSNGSYPGLDEPYEGPLTLTEGTTEVNALVVSEAGLVSRAAYGSYFIGRVVSDAVFEDEALESWVRYVLDLDDDASISTSMLWDIQALYLPEGVKKLTDLHYFENLSILSLQNVSKLDASPIAALKKLQVLDLTGCYLDTADLTAIGSVSTLEELYFSSCGISNISALAGLKNLKILDLNSNSIVSIAPLSELTTLTSLNLAGNAISDISPLATLTALEELDLSHNHLDDTAVLDNLKAMKKLSLRDCKVGVLHFIDDMPHLTDLDLSGNELTVITVLSSLKNLQHLDISNNEIADISFMGDMLTLSTLRADHNQVTELPYFNADCVLQTISINHNQLTDAAGVCDLFRLNHLDVDYNQLEDISYLVYCVNLVEVNAFGNPIQEVQELLDTGIIVNFDPTYILDHPIEETDDEEE